MKFRDLTAKEKGRFDSSEDEKLIGKTIIKIERKGIEGYDDTPYIILTFSDGSTACFEGNYGGYTGRSEDEYFRFITLYYSSEEKTTQDTHETRPQEEP